jgi:transposase
MARKNYPDEFKRDAVALYRDTEGATITAIAADLGIHDATLTAWCKAAGVPIRHRRSTAIGAGGGGVEETPEQELARLRTENQQLRADRNLLATEREILRKAAKYFAGETNW